MFSVNKDVEKIVENTLDPTKRAAVIGQLESRLKWNKLAVNLSLVTWVLLMVAYLIDRNDVTTQFLLLMFWLFMLSTVVAYLSTFQRLVQLKVEERRGAGSN